MNFIYNYIFFMYICIIICNYIKFMKKSTKFIMENRNKELGVNPFVKNLTINVRVDKVYDKKVLDTYIERTVELEADRYLKLFCYNSNNKATIRTLSPSACVLFNYVITELLPKEDVIRINRKIFKENTSIKSDITINLAIVELCKKGILAIIAGEKELYWINPDIFFTGNRISKYRETANVEQILINKN